MGDSLVTIVTIGLAAILLFIFPMMTLADRTDDISQITVQSATAEFVDEVRQTGKLTDDNYAKYIQKIESTGNKFDVELKLQRLDENPAKKTGTGSTTIGENTYYTVYTTQIEKELEDSNSKTVYLKQGDIFSASAVNINETLAGALKGFLYKITGNSSFTINAENAGIVLVDGQ